MKIPNVLNSIKNMRKKHYVMIIAAAVLLSAAFVVQSTFAWMLSSDSRNNQIGIMQFLFSHKIEENFTEPASGSYIRGGDTITKKNWVKNDGDIASFVRVKVFPVLTAPDGKAHMEAQFGNQLYYVNLNTVNWADGGDGYFYYLGNLAPGASTQPLFEKIELDEDVVTYSDAMLTVSLISETVETSKWFYRQAWWNTGTAPGGQLAAVDSALSALATD
jgi:hypothetical protein